MTIDHRTPRGDSLTNVMINGNKPIPATGGDNENGRGIGTRESPAFVLYESPDSGVARISAAAIASAFTWTSQRWPTCPGQSRQKPRAARR